MCRNSLIDGGFAPLVMCFAQASYQNNNFILFRQPHHTDVQARDHLRSFSSIEKVRISWNTDSTSVSKGYLITKTNIYQLTVGDTCGPPYAFHPLPSGTNCVLCKFQQIFQPRPKFARHSDTFSAPTRAVSQWAGNAYMIVRSNWISSDLIFVMVYMEKLSLSICCRRYLVDYEGPSPMLTVIVC